MEGREGRKRKSKGSPADLWPCTPLQKILQAPLSAPSSSGPWVLTSLRLFTHLLIPSTATKLGISESNLRAVFRLLF
jgi:hypothetical protein